MNVTVTADARSSPLHYVGLAAFTVAVLAIDAAFANRATQLALGGAASALLVWLARRSPAEERRAMWICVAYSTAIELFATQVWGLYTYRLGNVPLYVPPGHGLIFVAAAQAARTPFLVRHAAPFARVVAAAATVWMLGGLVLRPLVLHRAPDVHGALYWPFFTWFLLRSPRRTVYGVTFVATSFIEIVGVVLENWHWAPVMPGLGLTSADPPSVIAGGYCSFAVVATAFARIPRLSLATSTSEK